MATKKVYWNTIAQLAGKVSTALISIFLIKILTNYLDLEGYGLYSKVYNFLSIFSVIADLGLYTITVREISDHKDNPEKVSRIAGTVLSIRTMMGVGIIFLSLAIGFFLPGYDTLPALVGILIAGVFTLFGLANSSILSMLQAFLKTEFSFVSTTVGKIVNLVSMMAIVYWFFPHSLLGQYGQYADTIALAGVMIAGLLGNIVMTVMLYSYSRRVHPVGFRFDKEYAKHILKASLPYGLALFLNVVFFKIDIILLSVLEPRAIADTDIALYGVPMKIVEVGMMFGTVFLNSMLPLFTESLRSKDGNLQALADKAYRLLFLAGAGIAFFLAAAPKQIIAMIASPTYLVNGPSGYDASDAMRVVSFIFLFYFASSLFTYLLIASGDQKKLLSINSKIAIVTLLANAAVIPFFSFMGSAVVTLGCQILLFLLTAHEARHLIQFRVFSRFAVTRLALGALSAGCVLLVLPHLVGLPNIVTLAVVSGIFGVVYLGGIFGVEWGKR